MLSRSQQKLLRKLRSRKYRWQMQLFVAEGRKVVQELLDSGLECKWIAAAENSAFAAKADVQLSSTELAQWSQLEQADEVIGIFAFPDLPKQPSECVLVLDQLKDPGNLGTLIRTAEWFGINTIFCSTGTVDCYNAKSVQSSMGSIARVAIEYLEAEEIAGKLGGDYELLCADMDGEPLNEITPAAKMALVLGSESHGPDDFWKMHARQVTIPRKGNSRTESLNVAVAGAIFMAKLTGM